MLCFYFIPPFLTYPGKKERKRHSVVEIWESRRGLARFVCCADFIPSCFFVLPRLSLGEHYIGRKMDMGCLLEDRCLVHISPLPFGRGVVVLARVSLLPGSTDGGIKGVMGLQQASKMVLCVIYYSLYLHGNWCSVAKRACADAMSNTPFFSPSASA